MKKLFGLCTSLFSLCFLASSSREGCNKSLANYKARTETHVLTRSRHIYSYGTSVYKNETATSAGALAARHHTLTGISRQIAWLAKSEENAGC